MAKIYYNEAETAARLNISQADLANYVRDGKLRAFPDGPRKMFKVEEVEKLAAASGEIELAPADISLNEADKPRPAGKEDTVITAEGISIFDDEDLEIEAADPMAKTQIAPTLDEQVSIEGVGSGSGLLDLTRESDDTSLGEVLEHIDEPQVAAVGSGLAHEQESAAVAPTVVEVPAVAPTFVEIPDASSGAFNGIIVGVTLVMLLAASVAIGLLMQNAAALSEKLHQNLLAVLGAGVVLALIAAGIGFAVGKSAAQRQAAMQKVG